MSDYQYIFKCSGLCKTVTKLITLKSVCQWAIEFILTWFACTVLVVTELRLSAKAKSWSNTDTVRTLLKIPCTMDPLIKTCAVTCHPDHADFTRPCAKCVNVHSALLLLCFWYVDTRWHSMIPDSHNVYPYVVDYLRWPEMEWSNTQTLILRSVCKKKSITGRSEKVHVLSQDCGMLPQ